MGGQDLCLMAFSFFPSEFLEKIIVLKISERKFFVSVEVEVCFISSEYL